MKDWQYIAVLTIALLIMVTSLCVTIVLLTLYWAYIPHSYQTFIIAFGGVFFISVSIYISHHFIR